MKRSLALLIPLVALPVLVSACGGDSSDTGVTGPRAVLADRDATGAALANAWPGLVGETGSDSSITATPAQVRKGIAYVRPYLDPAFRLQRAGGERYALNNYVPLDIDAFKVTDVVVTEPRDDIKVVRYRLSTPGATAPDTDRVLTGETRPQLAVFKWDEQRGHWVIVDHANFTTPVAAICGQKPIAVTKEHLKTSAADTALGTALVQEWRAITLGKLKKKVTSPQLQIQLADGQGWPNAKGTPIKWKPATSYDVNNLSITRDGDLLVASYDTMESGLQLEGAAYRSGAAPRLLTYLRDPDGTWKLIGLANFAVPQKVPAGVKCESKAS